MLNETSLFSSSRAPLAERMRPRSLAEYVGQTHLLGPDSLIRKVIEEDAIPSMILWGPPGCGKTALAKVIASQTSRMFVSFSAVLQGVKEVRQIVADARDRLLRGEKGTILFVDEIHRFNKAQQDAFLPHVEAGTILLIGATTENPSFEVNRALLSRCRTLTLKPLTDQDIEQVVTLALSDEERGLGAFNANLEEEARKALVEVAHGDARTALNILELAVTATEPDAEGARCVSGERLVDAASQKNVAYDKGGEEHYNLISALHKSVRGSDPQASLYWLSRMLEGGADPNYIARRLVRMATEDIGLADPQALVQAVAARDASHFLGYPECDTALAQCVIYLACAPKSNRVEVAILSARASVREGRNPPVPLHIRNAPTSLMKDLGYGKKYIYDHDAPDSFSGQRFFPDELDEAHYYEPGPYGFEKEIEKRLQYWARLRQERRREGEYDE